MHKNSLSHIAFTAALACACLGPIAAQAQQQPSASAIAVARGVIESVKNSFVPTNPNLTRELDDVAMALHKELDAKSTEVLDQMARAYAARFTEQELKDLLVFYKTPLGQKFIREEPNAIEDGLKRAQQWADAFADTVMSRMRAEMHKKGHEL